MLSTTLKVVIVLASAFLPLGTVASPAHEPTTVEVWDANLVFEPGSEMPAKGELAKCVDTAVQRLGIDMNMQTDPALLSEILEKDMHLQDMPGAQKLLATDLKVGQSLRPMLEKVHEGLTVVHPAIGVVVCSALNDKTTASIFSAPNINLIKRSIHHMFLLDKITGKLAEDRVFMSQMYKHLYDKTQSMVINPSRIGRIISMFKAAGMFGVAKDYSVNKGIENYMSLREKGSATPDESDDRKHNLSVNILEATATDFLHGYWDNGKVGYYLARKEATDVKVVGENRVIRYGLSMNWARLYETWNLAFITVNVDYPNLLFPKLLIPRVLLADGETYIYERAIALWLSINFYLMADLTGQKHITLPNKEALATLWGKVNHRYLNYLDAKNEKI